MSRVTAAASALLIVVFGAGCAESLGRQTTHGALRAVKESDKPQVMVERAARTGAATAFDEFTTDERRAALAEISHDMANAAARGMRTELTEAIGSGEGPLVRAMAATAERVSQSAVFPECGSGPDRAACVHARIEALTRTTATGFAQTLREQLGLQALVVAFVAGVLCTLLMLFVVSTLRSRRELPLRRAAHST